MQIRKLKSLLGFIILILLFNRSASNYILAQTIEQTASDIAKMNVFILQTINKNEVFVGEAFYCDFYLLLNSELVVTDIILKKLPSFLDFKSKEIQIENRSYYDTTFDGFKFKKALLHRYILTPRKAGEMSVDGINFEIKLKIPLSQEKAQKYFNKYPNGYFEYSYDVSANPRKINVLQLPTSREKCVFVGDFEIDYTTNKFIAAQTENISLVINIAGIGDLSVPYVPTIEKTEGLKTNIYKTFDTFDIINKEIISKKTYEVNLFSAINSEYLINPIEILCFSPTAKEYYHLRTDVIPVFFVSEKSEGEDGISFNFFDFALIVVIVGIIVLIGIIYYYSKHLVKVGKRVPKSGNSINEEVSVSDSVNFDHFSDITKLYFAKASAAFEQEADNFLKELNVGIEEYVHEKFQIEKNEFSKEEIVEKLIEHGVPTELAQNYLVLTNKIAQVRFSYLQKSQQNIDKHKLFALVESYINELEKYLE